MKKILLFFCILICFFFSCKTESSYKMPYEPGIHIDEDNFIQKRNCWLNSGLKSYSYTYTYSHYLTSDKSKSTVESYIAYIKTENGTVSEFLLKEFDGKKEAEVSEEEWKKNMELFQQKGFGNFLIENVFKQIDEMIVEDKKMYKEFSDCYYANYNFEFLEQPPYLYVCDTFSIRMQEGLNGNAGRTVIKIENFKSL